MASVNKTTEGAGDLDDNFVNPDIPSALSWNVECEHFEDYKKVFLALYSTLKVRRANIGGQDIEYVTSRFCSLPNTVLKEKIRVLHASMNDARATPLWAYRLLRMAEVPPTMMTRSMAASITQQLSDASVNAVLENIYQDEENDSPDNENLPMEYVQRWISSAMNGIIYIHQKTRSGYVFYKWFEKYSNSVKDLSSKVDDMLLALEDRNSVNKFATEVGKYRNNMIRACEA